MEKALSADDVIVTERLGERPGRDPDYAAEARALEILARELAERPENLLQKLTDTIVEQGIADSAGISIDEETGEGRQFRWTALSGAWAHFRGGTMPFDASPCGIVIRRDAMLLFEHPERYFPAAAVEPPIYEILLVPFYAHGRPVGTLWINAHSPERRFDAEDARLLKCLARFASAGYQMGRSLEAAQANRSELERRVTAQTAELEASEDRYRTLFTRLDAGFCIVEVKLDGERGVDYRFVEMNPAFERQTGMVDAAGRWMRELAPDHEQHWFDVYGRVALTGEPARFVDFTKELGGRWYDVHAFRVGEPAARRVAILFDDVTDRKRAEAALDESRARLAAAFETVPVGLAMLDMNGRAVIGNSEYYRFLPGGVIPSHDPDRGWRWRAWHPDGRLLDKEEFPGARAKRGEAVVPGQAMLYTDDTGREIWTNVASVPVRDAGGDVIGQANAITDIDLVKRSADALRATEERQAFLLQLSDALRHLTDLTEIGTTTSRLLGEYLDVDRVSYGEFSADGSVVSTEGGFVRPGVAPVDGSYAAADFDAFVADLRNGVTAVVHDSLDAPSLPTPPHENMWTRLGIRAAVAVPLVKGSRLVAALYVHSIPPRRWSTPELELVESAAGRTWEAIERARAEAKLRESETRFRAFVNASSDVIYRMSPDWSEMRQLDGRGFLADTVGPSDRWMDSYIDAGDRAAVTAAIAHAISTKSMFELEHRVRQADGRLGWTFSRAVPILDGRGEIVEWLGTASDVTERHDVQDALGESERRFRSFAETSTDTLWIIDADTGQLEYLSPAYETTWGEPRDAVMADIGHWATRVHPDDLAKAARGMETLRSGRRLMQSYRIVRPDGEVRYIQDTGFPIMENGRVRRLAGVAQDLTERSLAELALARAERQLRTLMEGVPQLVWRGVDSGQWTWASPQWTAFTGQSDADSHDRGWLDRVHPDDRTAALEAWAHAEESGGFDVEYRLRRADGEYSWFGTRATPVRDDAGRIVEWLGTSTDIDVLRRLQERQGVLVAELQHRTRNLIGVVRSLADRTADGAASLDGFQDRFGRRLSALSRVQGLLSHLTAGERVSFDEILRSELTAIGATDGAADRVTMEGPAGVPLRSASVQTFALALHELGTNAIKYGALSPAHPDGKLAVRWHVEPAADGKSSRLHVEWRESGVTMPDIGAAPQGGGYGRELIERALPYQLKAKTSYELGEDGVRCTIALPIAGRVDGGFDHD